MRCIEMLTASPHLTISGEININMRCIEIYPKLLGDAVTATININMRCIEILVVSKHITIMHD